MNTHIPNDWRSVEKDDFREFLKTCDDYNLDAWCNAILYRFRHNEKSFAAELNDGRILVDPKLLV